VKHDKTSTKVAQITRRDGNGTVLEGALTVPNDANKYGPWAGDTDLWREYGVDLHGGHHGTVTAYIWAWARRRTWC